MHTQTRTQIPKIGSPMRDLRSGRRCYVETVEAVHELFALNPIDLGARVAHLQAAYGADWQDQWFKATVQYDDGTSEEREARDLAPVEGTRFRGQGYHVDKPRGW